MHSSSYIQQIVCVNPAAYYVIGRRCSWSSLNSKQSIDYKLFWLLQHANCIALPYKIAEFLGNAIEMCGSLLHAIFCRLWAATSKNTGHCDARNDLHKQPFPWQGARGVPKPSLLHRRLHKPLHPGQIQRRNFGPSMEFLGLSPSILCTDYWHSLLSLLCHLSSNYALFHGFEVQRSSAKCRGIDSSIDCRLIRTCGRCW